MRLLYNLGIYIYNLLVWIAANFNEKAALFAKGRKNQFATLQSKIDPSARYIWFHVASLGEFEQGRPLMERIKCEHPDYKIILTFFSPSGYEVRKNYDKADIVCYLPMDTPGNARRFVDMVHPVMAVFVKYEFWCNYLDDLKQANVPTYLVSAIFRPSQLFFKWYGGWYRKVLHNFSHLFVQDDDSVSLLKGIGISEVSVAGDTRFDRVLAIAQSAKDLPVVKAFKGESAPVLVAGSSWPKDEDLLIDYFNSHSFKMILAPHEVDEAHIQEIIGKLKRPYIRYTGASEEDAAQADCLIIDGIGYLSSVYRYGELAYIGGGFGVGIHNILEPAVYGMPVIFGPNYHNFREAVEMEKAGGAFSINSSADLAKVLDSMFDSSSLRLADTSAVAKEFVAKNCGATDLIMKGLFH